jgi:hypothetical protein
MLKGAHMKKAPSKPITATQRKELEALATLSDDKIDLREMPEIRGWSGARRGALYRPIKQQKGAAADRAPGRLGKHRADGDET